jgi:hypothetical protein
MVVMMMMRPVYYYALIGVPLAIGSLELMTGTLV